jgi:hypothetical protein
VQTEAVGTEAVCIEAGRAGSSTSLLPERKDACHEQRRRIEEIDQEDTSIRHIEET